MRAICLVKRRWLAIQDVPLKDAIVPKTMGISVSNHWMCMIVCSAYNIRINSVYQQQLQLAVPCLRAEMVRRAFIGAKRDNAHALRQAGWMSAVKGLAWVKSLLPD